VFAGLLHSKYNEMMMPAVKTSYMRTAEELRGIVDSTLNLLVDIEWMHLYIFLTTTSRATTSKIVLGHLSASLDNVCGHLMRHSKTTKINYSYLSLLAELSESEDKGVRQRFVRPLTLPAHVFLAPVALTFPLSIHSESSAWVAWHIRVTHIACATPL